MNLVAGDQAMNVARFRDYIDGPEGPATYVFISLFISMYLFIYLHGIVMVVCFVKDIIIIIIMVHVTVEDWRIPPLPHHKQYDTSAMMFT